ncbi:hypothetical protein [Micavibrio aeruginosavorus]|uniref:Lipoprotein n=1 Tax=Micavibrio aeruginosavorus EPB TaxID=349215 RepID=M4VDA0_9BACT|nr:hypothetical protein [Micavibrio aeruginosavorus]AGH97372.1 hypothetical protein A11S_548 [Micavibrio aeruginosavorus EPB]
MTKPFHFILTVSCLGLAACAGVDVNEPRPYAGYFEQKKLTSPAPKSFDVCRGYGCVSRDRVSLSPAQWTKATAPLRQTITNAPAERAAIAKSIGLMERIVGKKTGTAVDVAGTYDTLGPHQLDCVDESTNATVYMAMMEEAGLFKFHKTTRPTARVPLFVAQGPHQTAALVDIKTGERYAVDSWFHDNGHPAEIVPMGDWKMGWTPQKD